jgi:DNA polymerase III gamma/tau subunit
MTQEDWSILQEQTGKVSRETLQRLLEILMAEEETMRRTQSPRLVLEMALTRMAHLAPLIRDLLEDYVTKAEAKLKRETPS